MLTVSDNHIVLGGGGGGSGGGGGGGDVVGAASSTDNALVRWDGATGKLVQSSNVVIDDYGQYGVGGAPNDYIHLQYNTNSPYGITMQNTNGTPSGYCSVFLLTDAGSGRRSAILKNPSTSTIYGGANALVFYQVATDPISFVTGNAVTPQIFISGGGFVGINTVTPTSDLDVNGSTRLRGELKDNVGSSGADGQVLKKVGGLVLWSNP